MKELLSLRPSNHNVFYKNLNIIRKLKDYADKEKVTLLLDEYNKKQESDYFLILLLFILPLQKKIIFKTNVAKLF